VQAGAEVPAILGRVLQQWAISREVGTVEERITSTANGSITSVQAIYVPADNLTELEASE